MDLGAILLYLDPPLMGVAVHVSDLPIRVVRSFHKSDKSYISASVVDICLFISIMLS